MVDVSFHQISALVVASKDFQAFITAIQQIGVLFTQVAGTHAHTRTVYSKQDMLAIAMLGVRGPCKMGDIATHLGVVQSAITPLVDRLEAADVVERIRSQEDRRVWLVALTEKGRALYAAEAKVYETVAQHMLAPLNEDERNTLIALLTRIGTHVAEGSP